MEHNSQDEASLRLRDMIAEADDITIFTGAGISTESGIPDFRSPKGLWSQMKPIQFDDFVASEAARIEDWRRRFIMNAEFSAAEPNEGHRALVRLQADDKLACIITQNIDGLHQKSGIDPRYVIEIHGNSTYGACLSCEAVTSLEDAKNAIENTGKAPTCDKCGGLVKAAVISFGQPMPQQKLMQAMRHAAECDLFITLGSSLQVYPAANLPQIAHQSGAQLVIVNRDPTSFDGIADLAIAGEIGQTLRRIA